MRYGLESITELGWKVRCWRACCGLAAPMHDATPSLTSQQWSKSERRYEDDATMLHPKYSSMASSPGARRSPAIEQAQLVLPQGRHLCHIFPVFGVGNLVLGSNALPSTTVVTVYVAFQHCRLPCWYDRSIRSISRCSEQATLCSFLDILARHTCCEHFYALSPSTYIISRRGIAMLSTTTPTPIPPSASQQISPTIPPMQQIPTDLAHSSMPVERRPSNLAKHESQTLPLDLSRDNASHSDEESSTCSSDIQSAQEKEIGISHHHHHHHHHHEKLHEATSPPPPPPPPPPPKIFDHTTAPPHRPQTANPLHPRPNVHLEIFPGGLRRRTSLGPIEQSPVSPTTPSGFLCSTSPVPEIPDDEKAPPAVQQQQDEEDFPCSSTMDWAEQQAPGRKRGRRMLLIFSACSIVVLGILGVALGVDFAVRDRNGIGENLGGEF
ncbi:uncharacterized protein MYCFIDRAFT_178363 [Pseudocercospora fijiensis CIRAD86]|uniref:Uncharacterized protein n=1 Tax=Pseudocercospora fijiensis (strain CIRAD86) TaxID=383855 RepID=M3ARV8_PSEFD|nr:uncharacterized protein MYCFIDRAFT_178363 [Pseudocercospora fijiensis CIRAD86]EME79818.1 hypothetical protein MYCFIDRAFT_178363 [Pseudocercospora fijiensis CIRAD86]